MRLEAVQQQPASLDKEEEAPENQEEPLPMWVHEDEAPENEVAEVKKFVRRYLRKMYVDLLGPTVESYDFFSGCAITRDADCNWPEFAPLKDKAPESVLEPWCILFPGTVQDKAAPELVFCESLPSLDHL